MTAIEDEDAGPPATISDLSPRQLAVASNIARAKTDQQIAGMLGITDRTVRIHVAALAYLLRLDPACNIRIQIALWYREHCTPDIQHDGALAA